MSTDSSQPKTSQTEEHSEAVEPTRETVSDATSSDAPATSPSDDNTGHTVELEVIRHKQLYEMLKSPKAGGMAVLMLSVTLVMIFIALAIAALILKRFYPYNDISTNIYGVTTIATEDKKIDYWLFNTAVMWSNSGIEVKAGEEITIHSSGAWHTAVHHLSDNAKDNKQLADPWTGSEGYVEHEKKKNDEFRAKYRLRPHDTDGVLLMALVHDPPRGKTQKETHELICKEIAENKHDIYVIGRECKSLRIPKDGILFFSINDICLTHEIIYDMYKDYIDTYKGFIEKNSYTIYSRDMQRSDNVPGSVIVAEAKNWLDNWTDKQEKSSNANTGNGKLNLLPKAPPIPKLLLAFDMLPDNKLPLDSVGVTFGKYPDDSTKASDTNNQENDSLHADSTPEYKPFFKNELIYYYDNNFTNAWFVDNVGSLLIIVERKQ